MKIQTFSLYVNAGIVLILASLMVYFYTVHGTSITHPIDLDNPYHIRNHLLQTVFMYYSGFLMLIASVNQTTTRLSLMLTAVVTIAGLAFTIAHAGLLAISAGVVMLLVTLVGLYSAYQETNQ